MGGLWVFPGRISFQASLFESPFHGESFNWNNLIVSKAATLAQHHHLISLVPNLAAAFPRFLEN
jgi:hypothetical protein